MGRGVGDDVAEALGVVVAGAGGELSWVGVGVQAVIVARVRMAVIVRVLRFGVMRVSFVVGGADPGEVGSAPCGWCG